jgi:hypothetical protein
MGLFAGGSRKKAMHTTINVVSLVLFEACSLKKKKKDKHFSSSFTGSERRKSSLAF